MKQDRDDFTATIIGLILGWWGWDFSYNINIVH